MVMEVEAYDVVVELIALGHQFGESIADSIELWISISFAVIGAAYFAPERLNVFLTTFLLALYIAFTAHTFGSVGADVRGGEAAVADAQRVAEARGLHLELLELRGSGKPEDRQGSPVASQVFILGLFAGVLGFVGFTCFNNYRRRADP